MKNYLVTTAIATALFTTGPAIAASDTTQLFLMEMTGENMQASELIGMRVYASDSEIDDSGFDGVQSEWEDVGEINDIVLNRNGEIDAVLVDVGGFLGIGERQVAMQMDALKLVPDIETEEAHDFFVVVPASVAELENAPEFDMTAMEASKATAQETVETAATDVDAGMKKAEDTLEQTTAEVDAELDKAGNTIEQTAATLGTNPETNGDEAAKAPDELVAAVESADAKWEQLTTEDLTGMRVYDANGEWIGEINQLNVDNDGRIEAAIIDVGGFLGLGEKPVELELAKLDLVSVDGVYRIETAETKEALEELPTYEY